MSNRELAEQPCRYGGDGPITPHVVGADGGARFSARLASFVAEMPWERRSIAAFALHAAQRTQRGQRVLDVGAGDAPYRELFEHAEYVTSDWHHSLHAGARAADIIAAADDLPVEDETFDAVLMTQVLEHVARPEATLRELLRVLKKGGSLYLTAPLAWELHEEPFDFFRYTEHGLRSLVEGAGFEDISLTARTDSLTTLAQLMTNVSWSLTEQGHEDSRCGEAAVLLRDLASHVAALAPLDRDRKLPLGYQCTAKKPDASSQAALSSR